MKPSTSVFDSVDSIVNFLREPSSSEVVSSVTTSSTTGSTIVNNQLKSTKKPKKEKELMNVISSTQIDSKEPIQILSSGRVRYGPITVNPRKQPSKTLFTGRRSKYEILQGDEAERRRVRRERNRAAATKCREKRENVLVNLENVYNKHLNHHIQLTKTIQQLQNQKQYLQSLVSTHIINCPLQKLNSTPPPQQPSMVFGNTGFLPSIIETPQPLPFPSHHLQLNKNDEEEFSNFLQPPPVLTNSHYNNEQTNNFFIPEQQSQQQQQQQQQAISMNSSSLERLINSLNSPAIHVDNNNCSGLYNSANGSSSCAQQHSNSSEDGLFPSTGNHPFVC